MFKRLLDGQMTMQGRGSHAGRRDWFNLASILQCRHLSNYCKWVEPSVKIQGKMNNKVETAGGTQWHRHCGSKGSLLCCTVPRWLLAQMYKKKA